MRFKIVAIVHAFHPENIKRLQVAKEIKFYAIRYLIFGLVCCCDVFEIKRTKAVESHRFDWSMPLTVQNTLIIHKPIDLSNGR